MRQWLSVLRYRVWPEARKLWPIFLFPAGLLVSYVLALLAGWLLKRDAADQVRYFGTWLQLFGILLVAYGVRELRKDFNRPSMIAAMRAQIVAFVRSFRSGDRTVAISGVGSVALSGSLALGYGRVGGTVEQRLDGLAREIDALRQDLQERDRKLDDKLAAVRGEVSKEREERTAAHGDIQRKLDNVAVGGLYLDVIGLWWLLFATVATSVPDGVAWVLHVLFT
jgi:hypothetical protein